MKTLFTLILFVALAVGCATPPPPAPLPVPEPEPENPYAHQTFQPKYLTSTVEITTYYSTLPTKFRASHSITPMAGTDETGQPYVARGRGTGVVLGKIGAEKVWVLSAKHVLANADKVTISNGDGTEYEADIATRYLMKDNDLGVIGVISADLFGKVTRASFSDEPILPGYMLWQIGCALGGDKIPAYGPAHLGGRKIFSGFFARAGVHTLPGNSGGPIFYRGHCIGIVSAILVNRSTRQLYSHLTFYVPGDEILKFVFEWSEASAKGD